MNKLKLMLFYFVAVSVFVSCNSDDGSGDLNRQFGIFEVLDDDVTVEMEGVIGSSALSDFNLLTESFPNVNLVNIKNCDGSIDDAINLQLSLKVHQRGMSTHIMDNGEIASGGVDFFIAGVERTRGSNTGIGVHSWATDENTAIDFPVGHEEHQPYITYYVNVGFTQQEAEDFYYFTINAAPAESMHWMTEAEIAQYGLLTQ